jgi:hypothetical protein
MRKASAIALALSACLLSAALAWGDENPHASIYVEGACLECHVDELAPGQPLERPLRFTKDIVSICLECHKEKDVSSLHPVDVRPGMQVPDQYPLDESGQITCATCHNPHREFEAEEPFVAEVLTKRLLSIFTMKKKYRTFFLRTPNTRGDLCQGCHERGAVGDAGFHVSEASMLGDYAGSARCGECHEEKYQEWKISQHARMATDPDKNPEAVLGDFENNPPFKRDDVVYVLGSRWTQRYVVEKKGRLHVKAPIWSIPGKSWDRSYWIDKPWDQFCQGCHTTGFEMKDEPKFSELGIACEACHGPGRAHADADGSGHIINPDKIDPDRSEMICESCHTSGHDRTGQFRFPVGYVPGRDLNHYYKGLMPKPGQDNETFMGDGSYDDRRRQWEFWQSAFFNAKGITCDICKNFRDRKSKKNTAATMTVSEHCMTCHEKTWPESRLHAKHLDSEVHCNKCHIPKLAPGGDKYSIHDHKFYFGMPKVSEWKPLTETCAECHEK